MTPKLHKICLHSPAKVNLFLAITGLRKDGFHELISLVAPLNWGDQITVDWNAAASTDRIVCDTPRVPTDHKNLVLQAVAAYRKHVDIEGAFCFTIDKQIPPGSGLGGGSSNAAVSLMALNRMMGDALEHNVLLGMAARIGSDCPLFLSNGPVIMTGRGERVTPLTESARECLSGQAILVFRPGFGIPTAWAYQQMKATGGKHYLNGDDCQGQLNDWIAHPDFNNLPLLNNLQIVAFNKYLALPVLLDTLRTRFGLRCMMSGSGSSCFALPNADTDVEAVRQYVLGAWGPDTLFQCTNLA